MGTDDDILRHARDIYLEQGFAGLSMRAVASRVGVSATAIYRHYESKEALVAALCVQGFERFGQYLARGLKGKTPRARLDLTGEGYFDFAMEHRALYQIMFMSPGVQQDCEGLADRVKDEAAPTFQFLVDRVRECMDEGEFAQGDPFRAALSIWAHCHGFASLWMTGLDKTIGDIATYRALYLEGIRGLLKGFEAPKKKR
jgi:AcrR family transcriptional regulator